MNAYQYAASVLGGLVYFSMVAFILWGPAL